MKRISIKKIRNSKMSIDRKIAIAGLAISIFAIGFSLYQHFDSNAERIAIFKHDFRLKDQDAVRVNKNGNLLSLTIFFNTTVSNNTKRPISIVSFNISNSYNDNRHVFSGLDSQNMQLVKKFDRETPINLNSFESKMISLRNEIFLNKQVSNILLEAFKSRVNGPIVWGFWTSGSLIDSVLKQNSIDVFGNIIKKLDYNNEDINTQIVELELMLSNKNKFSYTFPL